ncbi:hypothetical protein [Rheinheimera sp.]|jgi:uncharacterized protein YecT (DUF1311 family)|uniref:hypothetical protein n=1 Tax=Rheinheimera sp. TaxID=1869214 RepID=UPI00260EFAA5|nr:hypothetical protein [Rheinheimera sp.]MCA1928742.1 DUF1311 domain-containing protein [Rheinheimera sp.]
MNKLLALMGLLCAFQLTAQQACDQTKLNKTDYMQCLDQKLEQSRRELTSWENNHQFLLEEQANSTGRKDGLKMFNKARQSFNTYVEQDCRWQFIGQLPDTDAAGVLYKECQLLHLKQRVEFLKQIRTEP